MTIPSEKWKADFRRQLLTRFQKLPDPEPILKRFEEAFEKLQASFRAILEGTGLTIDEGFGGLRYLNKDGQTGYQQMKYYTAKFGNDELYFMPFRLVQHPDQIQKYPGLIGAALISSSGQADVLCSTRVYVFEQFGSQLVWLYPTKRVEDWFQKKHYAIFDETILRQLLEDAFLREEDREEL